MKRLLSHRIRAGGQPGLVFVGWFAVLTLLTACGSKPAPPPQPRAAAEAESLARQATRLQAEENWRGAADTWQRAVRQYRLLHREAETALAQHNEAQARRALGQSEPARTLLEAAADTNQALALTNAWWRNQIALLQVDLDLAPARAGTRLDALRSRLGELRDQPGLTALFHHEEARLRLAQGRSADAQAALDRAAEMFRALRDEHGLAAIALTRARLLQEQNPAQSEAAWRDALSRFESIAYPKGVALALAGLGAALAENPDPSHRRQARAILSQAIANLEALKLTADAEAASRIRSRIPPETTETPLQ